MDLTGKIKRCNGFDKIEKRHGFDKERKGWHEFGIKNKHMT